MGSSTAIAFKYMMRNNSHPPFAKKEDDVQRLVNKLTLLVEKALVSKFNFSTSVDELLGDVFLLRSSAVKQIQKEGIKVEEIYETLSSDFLKIEDTQGLEELIENAKFGIRAIIRVGKKSNEENKLNFIQLPQDTPSTPYKQFKSVLKFALGDAPSKIASNLFNLFESSLRIETCLMTTHTLINQRNHLDITSERIQEISELIAQSTQLYGASAIGLGILGNKNKNIDYPTINLDEITEQIQLAEQGMDDYLNQITVNE